MGRFRGDSGGFFFGGLLLLRGLGPCRPASGALGGPSLGFSSWRLGLWCFQICAARGGAVVVGVWGLWQKAAGKEDRMDIGSMKKAVQKGFEPICKANS